ncbi:hypothetical protein AMECASPLE_034202 [Ameca splendens]|uniref:Uncharacterized protein n=1 Tax=Ameca splendens TaxID=208324 RepID=A0ABV0YIJ0_9TELE
MPLFRFVLVKNVEQSSGLLCAGLNYAEGFNVKVTTCAKVNSFDLRMHQKNNAGQNWRRNLPEFCQNVSCMDFGLVTYGHSTQIYYRQTKRAFKSLGRMSVH